MTPTVETPLQKRVKREINATKAAGKHGDNLQGSFNEQKTNTSMEPNIISGRVHHKEPVRINIKNTIAEDETKKFLITKGRDKVTEATIKGDNAKKSK
jgi:hypothetical protein